MSDEQHTHHSEHGTTTSYVIGFILSIIFTLVPYYLVVGHVLAGLALLLAIMGFAVLQMVIQIVFFLHIGREKGPRWQLAFFVSTVGIIVFVVGASMWIMHHLHYNMTPVTVEDVAKRLVENEGIAQIDGKKTGACEGQYTTHKVTLQDGAISPNQITAKQCDRITFINEDSKSRHIMFGTYEEPAAYGGEDVLTVTNRRAKTIILNQTGTHQFHDHQNPDSAGSFTVAP